MKEPGVPRRLYKYRDFSNRTLSMLIDDSIYFADPSTFNDPLDTKPALAADIDNAALEIILARLIEDRTIAEMSAAAKTIRYRGPKTLDHIARHGRKAAERALADLRYNATNPEYEIEDPQRFLLSYYIQEELLRRYHKGVFSLATRATCPLMWSHYADQHRGLCIGYSVPPAAAPHVRKMRYGGSRLVQASAVAAMLAGNDAARRRVDDDVLLRKAKAWTYECEWRMIGPRGEQNSPLELEEIVFGIRCAPAVKYGVVQALAQRSQTVRFFEIREQRDSFVLARHSVDISELASSRPRRCRDMDGVFDEFAAEIDQPSRPRAGPVKDSDG